MVFRIFHRGMVQQSFNACREENQSEQLLLDVYVQMRAYSVLVLSLSNSYIFIMPFEHVSGMIFGKFPPNLDVLAIPLLEVLKRFCNKLVQSIPALIGALPSVCRKFQFRHVQP